jgi:hypothetical protein
MRVQLAVQAESVHFSWFMPAADVATLTVQKIVTAIVAIVRMLKDCP